MQCTATRRDGQRCKNSAVRNMRTCRMHGSWTRQSRIKSKRLEIESKARKQLDKQGVDTTEPLNVWAELFKLTGEVVGLKDVIGAHLAGQDELDPALFSALERAMDRAARLLVALAGLGDVERRAAQFAAQQNGLVVEALHEFVSRVGLDMSEDKVRVELLAALRLVSNRSG